RVYAVADHQQARVVEADGLEVLQRGRQRDGFEVHMKSWKAHIGLLCQRWHIQAAVVFRMYSTQDPGDATEVALRQQRSTQVTALLIGQYPIKDFPQDDRAKQLSITGRVQGFQQACRCAFKRAA